MANASRARRLVAALASALATCALATARSTAQATGSTAPAARANAAATSENAPAADETAPSAGRVVFVDQPFEFDAPLCARLGADARSGAHVEVRIGAAPTAEVDPLAHCAPEHTRYSFTVTSAGGVDERDVCDALARAASITLASSDTLACYRLLMPGGHPTALGQALQSAHAGGALVIASGAAAPFLGRWVAVERAIFATPVRNPHPPAEHAVVAGLGLARDWIVDVGTAHGRPERVLRAAADFGVERALLLDGRSAWIDEGADAGGELQGSDTALLFDLATARHMRGGLREGRLAQLCPGERWDIRLRRVTPALNAPGATSSATPSERAPADAQRARVISLQGELDAPVLRNALTLELARTPEQRVVLASERRRVELWLDREADGTEARQQFVTCTPRTAFDWQWDLR